MTETTEAYWDEQAGAFDEEVDHGLRDPAVRAAWTRLLLPQLPVPPAVVADLGCGTGSLAVLLAHAGYEVRGIDLSARMLTVARAKAAAAGVDGRVQLARGDASEPPYGSASCDVVLARHVLWALPDADAALSRWVRLLTPDGRLLLVEGRWGTGSGISASECESLVLRHRGQATVVPLPDPALWGRPIADERYLLVSRD